MKSAVKGDSHKQGFNNKFKSTTCIQKLYKENLKSNIKPK